mmetsp:Transcript_47353/g.101386  ORF Transcript_47353/g.101386 Transcript_47353/m.101386 type:complete len:220 (-) Transcript_47353:35-694(-)
MGLTHTTTYSRHNSCVSNWKRKRAWPAKFFADMIKPELGTSRRWMKPKSNSEEWTSGKRARGRAKAIQSERRRHSTSRRWMSGSPRLTSQFSGLKTTIIPGKFTRAKGTPGNWKPATSSWSSPPGGASSRAMRSNSSPRSTMCARKGSAMAAVMPKDKAKDQANAKRSASNSKVSSRLGFLGRATNSLIFGMAAEDIASISVSSMKIKRAHAHTKLARC